MKSKQKFIKHDFESAVKDFCGEVALSEEERRSAFYFYSQGRAYEQERLSNAKINLNASIIMSREEGREEGYKKAILKLGDIGKQLNALAEDSFCNILDVLEGYAAEFNENLSSEIAWFRSLYPQYEWEPCGDVAIPGKYDDYEENEDE